VTNTDNNYNDIKFTKSVNVGGALNVTSALTVNGAEIPLIDHIHSNFVASGLNTVDGGGGQTIKTQSLTGYNIIAKGTSATVTLEGYWNLTGN
jgi:hypothetical protein